MTLPLDMLNLTAMTTISIPKTVWLVTTAGSTSAMIGKIYRTQTSADKARTPGQVVVRLNLTE